MGWTKRLRRARQKVERGGRWSRGGRGKADGGLDNGMDDRELG